MDIDYRGITVDISYITAVTPQQATPSPRYYRKFHLQNRGIPAVLPPSPLPCRALIKLCVDLRVRCIGLLLKMHAFMHLHTPWGLSVAKCHSVRGSKT